MKIIHILGELNFLISGYIEGIIIFILTLLVILLMSFLDNEHWGDIDFKTGFILIVVLVPIIVGIFAYSYMYL